MKPRGLCDTCEKDCKQPLGRCIVCPQYEAQGQIAASS